MVETKGETAVRVAIQFEDNMTAALERVQSSAGLTSRQTLTPSPDVNGLPGVLAVAAAACVVVGVSRRQVSRRALLGGNLFKR